MEINRIAKKTILYGIGNFSSKFLGFVLLPLYALYVPSNDLGFYDLTQTMIGLLTPLLFLAIWESILKFLIGRDDNDRVQIVSTLVFFLVSISIFGFIILSIFLYFLKYDFRWPALISFMLITQGLVYSWQYFARAFGENKIYVISSIIGSVTNFIFFILFIILNNTGVLGLLLALIFSQLSILLIIELKIRILCKVNLRLINLNILKNILKYSIPLTFNLVAIWMITGFGRLMIIRNLGEDANGIFSFSSRFSLMILMIGSVLSMAVIEEAILTINTQNHNSNFSKSVQSIFSLFIHLIIAMIPLSIIFYSLIDQTEYYSGIILVPILLLYAVITTMSSIVGSIFQAISRTKYQMISTLVGSVGTVLFSLLFIDRFGLIAIAYGQLIGSIIMLFIRCLYAFKFTGFILKWFPIIMNVIFYILIAFISLNQKTQFSYIIILPLYIVIFFRERKFFLSSIKFVFRK